MVTTDEVTTQEDNAVIDDQATPPEEVPESVPVEAPESEPEPPDIQALLDAQDDESIAEIPAVKSLLSRREEASRRSTEAEVNRQRQLADQEWLSKGDFTSDLQEAVSITGEGEDRQLSFDGERLQGAAEKAIGAARSLVQEENSAVVANRLAGMQVPAARLEQLTGLVEQVRVGKASYADFLTAQLDTLRDVDREVFRNELREELRAEWEKEVADGREVQGRREASANRAANDGATRGITGEAGSYYATRAEIDSAFIDGSITAEQYRAEREKPSYQQLSEY